MLSIRWSSLCHHMKNLICCATWHLLHNITPNWHVPFKWLYKKIQEGAKRKKNSTKRTAGEGNKQNKKMNIPIIQGYISIHSKSTIWRQSEAGKCLVVLVFTPVIVRSFQLYTISSLEVGSWSCSHIAQWNICNVKIFKINAGRQRSLRFSLKVSKGSNMWCTWV